MRKLSTTNGVLPRPPALPVNFGDLQSSEQEGISTGVSVMFAVDSEDEADTVDAVENEESRRLGGTAV